MPATKFDKPVFPGAKLVSATVTVTNTSGSYSNTFTDERIATSMRAFQLEIEDPSVFNDKISITTADGSFTIACDSVAGETDVTIGFLKIADDPTAVTSSEFTILNNRIGNLASLETTDKTSMVNAVNEVVDAVSDNAQDIENLADDVYGAEGTVTLSYHSGAYTGGIYSQNIRYKVCGPLVIVNGSFKMSESASSSAVYAAFTGIPYDSKWSDVIGHLRCSNDAILLGGVKTAVVSGRNNALTFYFNKQNGAYASKDQTIEFTIIYLKE